jgi:predicted dehydrogenase
MHAPLHAAGAETSLAGVWSPNRENAQELATKFGVEAFPTYEDLLDSCEAVDFAVPPDVQAALAPQAAAAGRALMLEKPLGLSLEQAIGVHRAITEHRVPNIVVLTKRFHPRTREFLAAADRLRAEEMPTAVNGLYLHGGFLDDGFLRPSGRKGWRQKYGALYDLGPHLLDLMDAAAGQIHTVHAYGDPAKYVALTTLHEGGATGQAGISGSVLLDHVRTTVDLFTGRGSLDYTTEGMDHNECWPILRTEFASAVRNGTAVTVDSGRALHLQALIEAAAISLHAGRPIGIPEVFATSSRAV